MADNDVIVRYLLRDEATPGLKRLETQAEATDRRLKSMGTTNGPLLTMFDALDGKIGNLNRQWDALDRKMMSTSRNMQHSLVFGLGAVTAGFTAAAGAATFFGLRAVNSFQHTQAAFSVLTGSMQQGQALYNQLLQLNLQSPFDQQPLASSAQTLLGFRIPQQQLLPILRNISNVAAVQQDPNEALMRMSLAVGQISQSGIVRAADLNQLVQAGFPAYRLIPGGHAALVGGSSGGGRMPSGQFINALTDPNNSVLSPYGGAASAMNRTLSGQWSNLTTLVRQEAIKDFSGFGNELVKEMPHFTRVLTKEVHELAPIMSEIGADLVKGFEGFLPVVTPILKALGDGLHELFQAGGPFLEEMAKQDPAIAAALGEFFGTLADDAPELAGLFGDLVGLLPPFVTALDDMIVLVDPVLKIVDGLLSLGPVRTVVADLLVALLAYRTLGPAIKAVLGMRDAMFGLAAAEEATTLAGGGAGLGGTSVYRNGRKVGTGARSRRGFAALGAIPAGLSVYDAMQHGGNAGNFLGSVGSGALTGAGFGGPLGALIGGSLAAGGWGGSALAHSIWGGSNPQLSQSYLNRASAWGDAVTNDPKLGRMMARYDASINFATGAIVVHDAKDPKATAKAIRDEIEAYEAETRGRR